METIGPGIKPADVGGMVVSVVTVGVKVWIFFVHDDANIPAPQNAIRVIKRRLFNEDTVDVDISACCWFFICDFGSS
jgi:hypothetical protein